MKKNLIEVLESQGFKIKNKKIKLFHCALCVPKAKKVVN